jgi:hypothetical protein
VHRAALLMSLLALVGTAHAFSTASVRFHGTGGDPAVDRIKVRIDPPVAADVGAGDFTIELWIRGTLADNVTPTGGYRDGDAAETESVDWIYGNIFVDRDIYGGGPDFGMSIHRDGGRGVLRFGTEGASGGTAHTLQGSAPVLDGAWHHVAFVRERTSGVKRIYVDGVLDVASSPNASTSDLSYPDARATDYPDSDPFLVFGAEKHGLPGTGDFPSFDGFVDEIRVWSVARTAGELSAAMAETLAPDTPGLVLYLRLEEGSGQTLADTVGGDAATLFAGVAGNGEWSTLTPAGPSTSSTVTTSSTATTSSAVSTSSTIATATTIPAATTSTTVLSGTTSTTLPRGCALDAECHDADPCTADRCDAGTCAASPVAGIPGLACRLEALASGALCSGADGDAGLEAVADRRLRRARALLLESEAAAGKREGRLLRRAAGQLAKLRRRTGKALRRERITPSCGATIDAAVAVLHQAILATPFARG